MARLSQAVVFIIVAMGMVRSKLVCYSMNSGLYGEKSLKELYDTGSGKQVQLENVKHKVRVFLENWRADSYTIYKFDKDDFPSTMPEAKYDQGAVDFGILECRGDEEAFYIKRRHLRRTEWCMNEKDLESYLSMKWKSGSGQNSEFRYGEDVLDFSKDGTKVRFGHSIKHDVLYGPFDMLPVHWDKLVPFAKNENIELRAVDTKVFGSNWDSTYFRAKVEEVSTDAINLINMGYRFDQTKFTCFIKDGYYYGYLSSCYHAAKPTERKSWATLPKVKRLDIYLGMGDVIQKLADNGYVHNNLVSEKLLNCGDSFVIQEFGCAQMAGEPDNNSGRPINRHYLRGLKGATADFRNDLYSFANIIVHIESGKALVDLHKDANGKAVDMELLYQSKNKDEPTHFLANMVKGVMNPRWGAADESVTIKDGQFGRSTKDSQGAEVFVADPNVNLSSAVLAIINENGSDMHLRTFRRYLQALKDRTAPEELI